MIIALACADMPSANCAEIDAKTSFERDVRPVLKQFCFRCHGPEKQKAKLRLDTLGIT
jgi:hypothetical protein